MNVLKAITNAQVVTENGIIWDGVIVIENGKIAKFGNKREVEIPLGAEIIDAKGEYVGPGLVDIHVHGGSEWSTSFDLIGASEYFLSHGATSILATPFYVMDFKTHMEAIAAIKRDMGSTKTVKGIYFEGPFTNPKFGASKDTNPWRNTIEPEQFKAIVDEAGLLAKVWAIAPERPDVMPFLEYARKVNPDVVFAIGHSEATPSQIRALGKYKPTIQTHTMNATGRIEVPGGTRGYGPDEYCFRDMNVYTELISDSCGIHVNPDLQQLLLHNKGVERIILITDCTQFDGASPEELAYITDLNFDHNGGLAGSKMTMELTCRNIMANTNCGIAQAFIMASTNPARAVGLGDEIGSVEVGKQADLIFVDDKFNIKNVIIAGEECC